MDISTIVWAVLMGAVNGMGISVIGMGSQKKIPRPDCRKFFITVMTGAIIGAIAGYNGWDYLTAEQWATSSGLILFIYLIGKAIWRRINDRTKTKDKED